MIEVKNLVKRYGNHTAVNDLSFRVDRGQVLGFLGPNGAGKSTTMNIITGYISATDGTVTVNGIDVYEEPETVKKMIGYLPEQPPLYPDMTVREYLDFVADIKKVKKSQKLKMLGDVMEATKITHMSERLIKHLSKGYKQRVGLAQAIMGYPELIILDEPTVGLDPKQIIEIRDLIRELSKNHTVILSSHIMQEVSAVCDMVLIIDKGKLVLIDKPQHLSTRLGMSGLVKLEVKGNSETVLNELKKIEKINKVEEVSDSEGVVSLTLYCKEEDDICEEVFYAMCNCNTPILELHTVRMSLEDIFLKVTNQDASFEVEQDQEEQNQEEQNKEEQNRKEQEVSSENKSEEEVTSDVSDL